jgi:hypothetical protein
VLFRSLSTVVKLKYNHKEICKNYDEATKDVV